MKRCFTENHRVVIHTGSGHIFKGVHRVVWLLITVMGIAACAPGPFQAPDPPADIVIISLDTLRPDRVSAWGHPRPTSTFLDRLALRGAQFIRCSTSIPTTGPAHATIFTGLYPIHHGSRLTGDPLAGDAGITLAEILKGSGYETMAVVTSSVLWPQVSGLDRGFERYMSLPKYRPPPKQAPGKSESNVEDPGVNPPKEKKYRAPLLSAMADVSWETALEKAGDWIGEDHQGPRLLFVHFYDVHQPYMPPAPYRDLFGPAYGGEIDGSIGSAVQFQNPAVRETLDRADAVHMEALYDGGVRYVDAGVERVFELLRKRGKLDSTLVIITGDHGEGFGEWGNYYEHGDYLSESEVQVPCIVIWPGVIDHRIFRNRVGLVDFLPTITDLAGVTAPEGLDGRSIAGPLLRGDPVPPARYFLETTTLGPPGNRYKQFGVILGENKYVSAAPERDEGLYDLNMDPREKQSLVTGIPDLRAELSHVTAQFMAEDSGQYEPPLLDEVSRNALQSLGYLQ